MTNLRQFNDLETCSRCVMDTSDPDIVFDAEGVCSHCKTFDEVTSRSWFPNDNGEQLENIIGRIRASGVGAEYDCVLGLSGGVDSSLLALRAKEWDLRVLAVHVDAGWNTELAVHNIERIVEFCGFDLLTHVVDWDAVRDLQLAYLRSGVSNQDVPQDHAFFAKLYRGATEHRIRYVLSGGNIATEAVFPKNWHGSAMDSWNIKAINRRFGSGKLGEFPTIGFLRYYIVNPYVHRLRVVRPLNYLPYHRDEAIAELTDRVGFKDYGRKHGESQFTRFFQNCYLPARYGYDKRKPHLSSMILSGQITRNRALQLLAEPLYGEAELEADRAYIVKKLRLTREEFDLLLDSPTSTYTDFRNQQWAYASLKRAQLVFEKTTGRQLSVYG